MRAIIFASAQIDDYSFCKEYIREGDILICCDGGIRHAKALGIDPDYIVGDFDSAPPDLLCEYKEKGIPFRQFPTRKDETDMELGMDFASMDLGIKDIVAFGGIGSRFDHTLANAHLLLRLLKKGVRGRLVNEHNCVEVIEKPLKIYGKAGDIVSTLPLSMEVTGITLTGFSYPLTEKTLTVDDDLVAVSNIMLGEEAEVSIRTGYLYVILAKD